MSISKHLQDKLALLPDSPGCYIMKDENQNDEIEKSICVCDYVFHGFAFGWMRNISSDRDEGKC